MRELVEETGRYHLIGLSALDHTWMDRLAAKQKRPFLFLAEGLLLANFSRFSNLAA